jgi:aminoglycoside 6'-N-acetyltransferase
MPGELVLQGERVTLRLMTEEDLPRLLEIVRHPEISDWWPEYDIERLRADTLDAGDATCLSIEFDGEYAGLVMFTEQPDPYYRSAGIDITLVPAVLGKGLGSDVLRTLCRYLFEERGHHRITIDPALANERAIAAYRKVGFRDVGVMREYERGPDGVWHDNLLMDMLHGELH